MIHVLASSLFIVFTLWSYKFDFKTTITNIIVTLLVFIFPLMMYYLYNNTGDIYTGVITELTGKTTPYKSFQYDKVTFKVDDMETIQYITIPTDYKVGSKVNYKLIENGKVILVSNWFEFLSMEVYFIYFDWFASVCMIRTILMIANF